MDNRIFRLPQLLVNASDVSFNSNKLPENLPFGSNVIHVHNTTVYKILTRTRRRGKSVTKFLMRVACRYVNSNILMQIFGK